MQKTKLYQLFSLLSSLEKVQLKRFLRSPYFNKREDVVRLFEFMRYKLPKIKVDNSRQLAFAHTYPDKVYNERDAYLVFSYLFKLIEEFLAFETFRKDEAQIKFYTAKSYRDRKLGSSFSQKLNESRHILSKSKLRNSDYLRRLYDLENERYNYLSSTQRSDKVNLDEVSTAFDVYYISEKLRHHCFQISHQAIFTKDYNSNALAEVLQIIDRNPSYLDYPPIAIYYSYYQAITTDIDELSFQQFRNKIETHKEYFTITELADIYLAAINICIRRANKGGQYYINEIFELHKNGIEQGLLFENDELSPFVFKNIMSASLKLGKLDWLEKFIHTYQSRLSLKVRDSIVAYSMALLRFEQKNYSETMRLLATLESEDFLLILGAKTIQLRIYYELKEFDALEALLESMRIYLQRKKKMGYHKEIYQNVIRLTRKLIALPGHNKEKKMALKLELNNMQPQSMREWFLEQVEEKS